MSLSQNGHLVAILDFCCCSEQLIKFQSFFLILYSFLRYVKKKEKLFMVYIIKKVTDVRIITIIVNKIKIMEV